MMLTNGHRNSVKPWSGHRGLNGLHVADRAYSESEDDDYSDDTPVYENVQDEDDAAVYENVSAGKEHVYDDPAADRLNLPVLRTDTGVYENMDFDEVDECAVYENVNDSPTYDVPHRRPLVVDTGRGNQLYSNLDSGPLIPEPDYDGELGSRPAAMETLKSLSGYGLSGLPALASLGGFFTAPTSVNPHGNGSHESGGLGVIVEEAETPTQEISTSQNTTKTTTSGVLTTLAALSMRSSDGNTTATNIRVNGTSTKALPSKIAWPSRTRIFHETNKRREEKQESNWSRESDHNGHKNDQQEVQHRSVKDLRGHFEARTTETSNAPVSVPVRKLNVRRVSSSNVTTTAIQNGAGSDEFSSPKAVLNAVRSLNNFSNGAVKLTSLTPLTPKKAQPVSIQVKASVNSESAHLTNGCQGSEKCNGNGNGSGSGNRTPVLVDEVPSIVAQFGNKEVDPPAEARPTTAKWDPTKLLEELYKIPEPLRDKPTPKDRVNIEGFLDKLPSGRRKATFWNAWKRRYFSAKDGYLYCYPTKHSDKPCMVMQLMGGQLESFESMLITAQDRNPVPVPMIGIDDRMGHYLVVRATSTEETARWLLALRTHTVEDFCSTYVQPWPMPKTPALLRDIVVVDLGGSSVRAGVLSTQPTLPQLFFPAIAAQPRGSGERVFGMEALNPQLRSGGSITFPLRPTDKITKHSLDLAAVMGVVRLVFRSLALAPREYGLVLSMPRALDTAAQAKLVKDLFDGLRVRSLVLSHQSVLALYAYNATSGVVVDIGERIDVLPIMDGYIVEGGVSRESYGGPQVTGHVRRFLHQRAPPPPLSFATPAESFLLRLALERLCFCAADYSAELKRAQREPEEVAASVSVRHFFDGPSGAPLEHLTLDAGRFQAAEGLFHPQAWGLDNHGVHQMVHKAIQECSMDARKTMARSVFLAGGLTLLPGFPERLHAELQRLLPSTVVPKVHASPYRYHAAYIGACVLANSPGVHEMQLTREEWVRDGGRLLRPWIL